MAPGGEALTMRAKLVLGLLLLAALAGSAGYGWMLAGRRAIVLRHVPATPNLSAFPADFADRIAGAEAQAHSWRHAAEGLAELARLYHANGFYPEALVCYDGLRAIEPKQARWPHLQACIIADFGRMDEALPLRERVTALAPDYIPGWVRLGDVLLKANRPAEAARVYTETLRRAPGQPYALLGLARCDLAGGNWPGARTRLQDALAQNPAFIGAMSLLVTVSEHQGDTATADALRTSIGRREFTDIPDPWLAELSDVCFDSYRLSVAAAIASSAGDHAIALDLLDRAIALAPNNGSYRRQYGQMLLNDREFDRARGQLEKAVEVAPTDSDAWLQLMNAQRGLGDEAAAANTLLRGLQLCPQSPTLHFEYGRLLKAGNRPAEAIDEFRRAYELRPNEVLPLIELAGQSFALNRNADALAALNLALERQPGHPLALASLAVYAIMLGDEKTALQRWEQIRRQPKAPAEVVAGVRQAYAQRFGRSPP